MDCLLPSVVGCGRRDVRGVFTVVESENLTGRVDVIPGITAICKLREVGVGQTYAGAVQKEGRDRLVTGLEKRGKSRTTPVRGWLLATPPRVHNVSFRMVGCCRVGEEGRDIGTKGCRARAGEDGVRETSIASPTSTRVGQQGVSI